MGDAWLVRDISFQRALKRIKTVERPKRITVIDEILRHSFLLSTFKAKKLKKQVEAKDIYQGICTYTHWYNHILGNPKKLAFITNQTEELETDDK